MSTRRSAASTVAAVVISVIVLAVLVAFVALGSDPEGGKADGGSEDLPDGFSRIPDDVFFERLNGSQRTATSWHFAQDKKIAGTTVTSIQADTELDDDGEDFQAQVSYCCDQAGEQVPFEVVSFDGDFYAAGLGAEKPWWRIGPASGPEAAGLIEQLRSLVSQETSPELQESVDSIKVIGPDSVAGVSTLHYRIVIKAPTPPSPAAPAPSTAAAEAQLDVWVDQENRPVRLVLTVGSGATRVETVTTYTKYGEDFDIAAPPAAETTDKAPQQLTPGATTP